MRLRITASIRNEEIGLNFSATLRFASTEIFFSNDDFVTTFGIGHGILAKLLFTPRADAGEAFVEGSHRNAL